MKKALTVLMAGLISASTLLGGCANNTGNKPNSTPSTSEKESVGVVVADGYTRYDITTPHARKTEGFGTQFDTCIVEKQNAISDEEWEIQVNALKEMNLQNVRIRFFPEWYERGNDNDDPNVFDYYSKDVDFNSAEMKYLYRILDAFEENGVKVDLSWYGCRTTYESEDGKYKGSWLGGTYGVNGVNVWCVAPTLTDNPNAEFAESVSACLKYLLETKRYTCVNEISIFPEPEGVVGANNLKQLMDTVNLIKARLIDLGIKDKIKFSGPADYGNNYEAYETKFLSSGVFEKATSSVYPFNVETPNAVMLDFAKGYTETAAKYDLSWGIAECGTNHFINPVRNEDTDTYDRALFMAKFFTNMLNGGCTNIKYFVFSDCMYDGPLNELGLFKWRGEKFKAKPVWYSWSLLCKYTDIGSEIFPVTVDYDSKKADDNMSIVALKLPDGSWTYVAVNDGETAKKIAIVNEREDRAGEMSLFRVTGASIPEDGALKTIEASSTVNASAGVVYATVPAMGFIVLSNKTF